MSNLTIDRTIAVLLAATVLVVACASSSVDAVVGLGASGRWVLLVALAAVALLAAARSGGLSRAPREPAVLVAGCLLGLCALSAGWSVDARLSLGRAVSWGTMLVAAAAIGWAAAKRPSLAESALVGLLAGAVAVEAAGIAVLLLAHDHAVQAATLDTPFRYRGLGENPNTVPMLAAVTLPLALWALLRYRDRTRRSLTLVALALSYGTIVFSGSRGALVAGFVGALTVALAQSAAIRSRLVHAGAVAALFLGGVALAQLPQPERVTAPGVTTTESAPTGTTSTGTTSTGTTSTGTTSTGTTSTGTTSTGTTSTGTTSTGTASGETPSEPLPSVLEGGPLIEDAGRSHGMQTRSLFGSSGRLLAWRFAIGQGNDRPVLGYGFGTEELVFVDRVYSFQGGHAENSLIGMYLQLGLVGALLLIGSLVAALWTGMRVFLASPSMYQRGASAGMLGVVSAGSALALVQSYVYSAGNVASLTVWTALLMFALAGRGATGAPS